MATGDPDEERPLKTRPNPPSSPIESWSEKLHFPFSSTISGTADSQFFQRGSRYCTHHRTSVERLLIAASPEYTWLLTPDPPIIYWHRVAYLPGLLPLLSQRCPLLQIVYP